VSLGNIWLSILESVLESVLNRADTNFAAILERKIGWGGRIRTFTILINSEVSYRLDHAPAGVGRVAAVETTSGKIDFVAKGATKDASKIACGGISGNAGRRKFV
jgi:hypothetical protein